MRFFERLGRLVRADAHGVMDSLEERSLLLKQHLREAELALARKRAQSEALGEQRRELEQEAEGIRGQLGSLDEDVELALSAEKHELARFAVRQLLARRRTLAALDLRIAQLDRRSEGLADRLPQQQRALEELRARVKVQLAAAEQRSTSCELAPSGVADEEIELELLRRRESAVGAA